MANVKRRIGWAWNRRIYGGPWKYAFRDAMQVVAPNAVFFVILMSVLTVRVGI